MPDDILVGFFAGIALLIMFAVFIITFFTINKRKKEQLVIEKQILTKTYTENLLKTKLEIQEQTIKTISQEIHDNIGQVLSLAKLNLGTFPDCDDDSMNQKMSATKQLVSKAILDLRNLSRSMYGDRISELGLRESVDNELKIVQNTGQVSTKLVIKGEPYKLDPQQSLILFRIMQESLNNAVKYSKSSLIEVTLDYRQDAFILSVADNGVGFNTDKLKENEKGIGITSMQSRASLVGGNLNITSRPGYGTVVTASIPVKTN